MISDRSIVLILSLVVLVIVGLGGAAAGLLKRRRSGRATPEDEPRKPRPDDVYPMW